MKRKFKIPIALSAAIIFFLALAWFRFCQPYLPQLGKGGIGVIGNNTYVVTKSDENMILWGSGETWHGKRRSEAETVIFDGSEVKPFSSRNLKGAWFIIRFAPDKISIYNLQDWSGGYYLRISEPK